jgi:hypothetical protein
MSIDWSKLKRSAAIMTTMEQRHAFWEIVSIITIPHFGGRRRRGMKAIYGGQGRFKHRCFGKNLPFFSKFYCNASSDAAFP